MAIITSIKQQKDKNRVNVYLDNKFAFGIDLDNFVILGLKVGQELEEKEIKKIIKTSEFQKTLDKLTRFVMVRPRSEKEIRDYLKRKKAPEVIWKDLSSRLKEYDMVNDENFTKWWVETRNEFSPKSTRVLTNELKLKGIKKEVIEKVLSENKVDEDKLALTFLIKRKLHWQHFESKKLKQKMLEYLVRKGFNFDVAEKAIKVYNSREDDKVN